MINIKDLSITVLRPALHAIDLYSLEAEILLAGTALVESLVAGETRLKQITGPAVGIFQMEPFTFNDIIQNYLAFRPDLHKKISALALGGALDPQQCAGNLYLAAAMARIKYLRSPLPIPDARDSIGMANLHKTVYNTADGKADPSINAKAFELAASTIMGE